MIEMSDIKRLTRLIPKVQVESNVHPDLVREVQQLRENLLELLKSYRSVHYCQMEATKGPHMYTKRMEVQRIKAADAKSTYLLALANFYDRGQKEGRNAKEQQDIKTRALDSLKRAVVGRNKDYMKNKDLQKAYKLLEGGELKSWYNTQNNDFLTYLKDYFTPYGIHLKWDRSKSYGDDQLFNLTQAAIDHYIGIISKPELSCTIEPEPETRLDASIFLRRYYTVNVVGQRMLHIANTRMYHLLQVAAFAEASTRVILKNKFKKAALMQQLQLSNLTIVKECVSVLSDIVYADYYGLYDVWMPKIESCLLAEQLLEILPEFERAWLKNQIKNKFQPLQPEISLFQKVIQYHTQLMLNILYKERKIADTEDLGDKEPPYCPIWATSFREIIKEDESNNKGMLRMARELATATDFNFHY